MLCAHHKHDNVDGIVRNEPWVDTERDFVKVCHCESCVKYQSSKIMDALRKHFYKTSMQLVACPTPGGCKDANTIIINDQILRGNNPEGIGGFVDKELKRQADYKELHPQEKKEVVKVCFGPSCSKREAEDIEKKLWVRYKNDDKVEVIRCGCTGNCSKAMNIVVNGNIISRQSPLQVINNVDAEMSRQRMVLAENNGALSSNEVEDILGL